MKSFCCRFDLFYTLFLCKAENSQYSIQGGEIGAAATISFASSIFLQNDSCFAQITRDLQSFTITASEVWVCTLCAKLQNQKQMIGVQLVPKNFHFDVCVAKLQNQKQMIGVQFVPKNSHFDVCIEVSQTTLDHQTINI